MEYILIVEDEQAIRETLKEILELSGYDVTTSKNGKEGYDAIMENKPDLVLCDVNMPELDGFELLGALNQRMKDEVIPPFIFLTARVETQSVRQGMGLGADDYILKPFDHNQVLDIVRMRLDKRKKLMNTEGFVPTPELKGFNKLALPCEEGLMLVPFDDIIKCQADRAYCTFHLNGGKTILISSAMKEFEQVLLENKFLKVHKSTIVNIKYAQKYVRGKGGQLIMSDDSVVYVSVRKKDVLMKVLKA